MQDRVAGLYSIRRSGTPNIDANLLIRGFNSLYATNQPLIVVDGMIYDNSDYGEELIKNNFTSPLAGIEIRDIEDITVVKDGSSLYGTKGANGVIMITTTRPKDLTTRIDAAVYGGFNQAPKQLPVMGAIDYRIYMSQMLRLKGLSQTQLGAQPFMNDDTTYAGYYKYHNNTNWQDQVFRNSYTQNYYLKVTGGDNIAKYALSVGYLSSDGITKNTGLHRYNTRLNADLKLTPKLTMQGSLSFVYSEQNLRDQGLSPKTNPIYLALTKSPFMGMNEIAENGKVSPNLADIDDFNVGNPGVLIENAIGMNRNYRFFGNLNFGYEFNKSFHLASVLGLTYDKVRENFFIPNKGVASDTLATDIALNRSGSEIQRLFSIFNDTYLDFNKNYSFKHAVKVRLGLRTQTNKTESDFGLGYNSATDDFVSVGAGTNTLRKVGGVLGDWNWMNMYLATNYGYLNRYFVSFNLAMDGSSRFGKDAQHNALSIGENKFALMPSIAGAWLVSSEPFMASNKFINLLKIRTSYGLSGNDDIGNYTARKYYISQNLLGLEGLVRGNIGNPALQWETIKKANLGLDISVLKERLSATIDVFSNKTSDMIIYEPVNNASGFSYVLSNSGSMNTKGFEIALNGRVLNQAVKLDLGLNLSKYKNKVTSLPVDEIITQFGGASFITKEGQDANLFYGLQSKGVYATNAEASSAGLSKRMSNGSLVPFAGGDIKFNDLNGDHVIDDQDRTVIGNPNPDWLGMFNGTVSYSRFTLNALFGFSIGNDLYNGTRASLEQMSGYENQSLAVSNRWRADGQITSIPKASWGDPMGNAAFSDRWIEDGSYLRLRTIALSYNLPVAAKQIKYAKIYVSANNLITVTNYLGYDPEFSASPSIFGQGVDIGLEPQFKTFQLGFRIGL
jgi:TonB-linked SusC/RagA family outer membrane protein